MAPSFFACRRVKKVSNSNDERVEDNIIGAMTSEGGGA